MHDASDLVGSPEPGDGDLSLELLEHRLGDLIEHLGGDEPGRDSVNRHADRILGQLARAM